MGYMVDGDSIGANNGPGTSLGGDENILRFIAVVHWIYF